MMKGYLTVFLSLSLSILIGFVFFLTGTAIGNAERVRMEESADVGMNSVLGEYHIGLHDRYGLIYIDASYLNKEPSVVNVESRLKFFIRENLRYQAGFSPWGEVSLTDLHIINVGTAAEGMGSSMKYQAVCYIQDTGIRGKEASAVDYIASVAGAEASDPLGEWSGLQEQIAGMELPWILNDKGEWEEVPLGNPADAVFGLTGSDILYLLEADGISSGVSIRPQEYISGRILHNVNISPARQADDMLFLSYLFAQMGHYRTPRENSLLQYQLEYIAKGRATDYENLKAVAENLLQWRFAQNVVYALENPGLYGDAWAMAGELHAVILKPEFQEPVTRSILYACAYLESLAEVKCLMSGGQIRMESDDFNVGVDQIVSGSVPSAASLEGGIGYEEYLACMLLILPDDTRNLRSMDIMEMDLRFISGSPYFSMDWCIERYTAEISARNSLGKEYKLCRTYGYY